jgi:hypothetical protein
MVWSTNHRSPQIIDVIVEFADEARAVAFASTARALPARALNARDRELVDGLRVVPMSAAIAGAPMICHIAASLHGRVHMTHLRRPIVARGL